MEQKSKNLVDILSELDGDRIVKIGAKGGTSFFYCGDVETFLENIEEYSNDCYTTAKRMRDRAWIHLEPYLEKPSKAANQNYSMWLEELSKRARAAYITNRGLWGLGSVIYTYLKVEPMDITLGYSRR